MDFNSYLLKKIALNGSQPGSFGSLTMNNIEQLQNVSLFSSASLEQLEDLNLEELLQAENATDVLPEDATSDQKALNEIVKALMGLEEVQGAADIDGNGEISDAEAMEFLKSIMGNDGDIENLTYDDINKAMEQLGIDLEKVADKAIEEALAEELQEMEEAKEAEKTQPTQQTSNAGGSGGAGGTRSAGRSNSSQQAEAGNTPDEIRAQIDEKNAEIETVEADAEAQIAEQEEQKEALMKQYGVSEQEYQEYQEQEQELEKNIQDKDKEISAKDDEIRDNESTISSNENYIGTIEAQISANEQAKSGISSDDENATERQAEIDGKIKNLQDEKAAVEKENEELEAKNAQLKEDKAQLEEDKKDLETQKQELLNNTLNNSEGFANGIGSASDVEKIKANIAKTDEEIAKIRENRDTQIAGIKDEIQALEVKLKDAEAAEERNELLKQNSAFDGQSIIDLAMTFDGKSQSEMREIMRNAGYQFDDGAWCADFVSFIAGTSIGEENLADWYKNCGNRAYCPTIHNAAIEAGATVDVAEAQPGDAILFDWDGDGTADHIGYVMSVNDDGTVNTIEGNTSPNGGGSQVATRTRNPQSIMTCVRLTA